MSWFCKPEFKVRTTRSSGETSAARHPCSRLGTGNYVIESLSVVGFNNVPDGASVWPGLTTVAQPMPEMGHAACRKLFATMPSDTEPQIMEYPTELVVRESTGPPLFYSQS